MGALLEEIGVLEDDVLDGVVAAHHLLVVAVALGGRPGPDGLAHHHIDLLGLALLQAEAEQICVLLQESNVSLLFCLAPGVLEGFGPLPSKALHLVIKIRRLFFLTDGSITALLPLRNIALVGRYDIDADVHLFILLNLFLRLYYRRDFKVCVIKRAAVGMGGSKSPFLEQYG